MRIKKTWKSILACMLAVSMLAGMNMPVFAEEDMQVTDRASESVVQENEGQVTDSEAIVEQKDISQEKSTENTEEKEPDRLLEDSGDAVDSLKAAVETKLQTMAGIQNTMTNLSFTAYSTHGGLVLDGLDDQVFITTIQFETAVRLVDGKNMDDFLKELTIKQSGSSVVTRGECSDEQIASYGVKYAEAEIAAGGTAVVIKTHIGIAGVNGRMEITANAPDGVLTALAGTDGSAVAWTAIDYYMPTGVQVETISQTAGTSTTPASLVKKVIAPQDTTRGMVHMVLLKNGIPLGSVNSYGANLTSHYHNYLSLGAAGFAKLCANAKEEQAGGALKGIAEANNLICYSEDDTITITGNTPEDGAVYDLLVTTYPRESRYLTNVNKESLRNYISLCHYEQEKYPAAKYAAYTQSLAKAKAIADSAYYFQSETDAALAELKEAVEGLKPDSPKIGNTTITRGGTNLTVSLSGDNLADWSQKIQKVTFNGQELTSEQYAVSVGTRSSLVLKRTDEAPLITTPDRQDEVRLTVEAEGYTALDTNLTLINYGAKTFQIRVVDREGKIYPIKTYTWDQLENMKQPSAVYYSTACGMAGLRTFKAEGVLLNDLLNDAGVTFGEGMELQVRTNDMAKTENDSAAEDAYYGNGRFTYDKLMGKTRYYLNGVYGNNEIKEQLLGASKFGEDARKIMGKADKTPVEPMIGLRYVESIYREDKGASPAEKEYSQMVTNERAMRFLFGLSVDESDDTMINAETTTFSATYTAFGVDIIDPDYKPEEKPGTDPGTKPGTDEKEKYVVVDSSTGISIEYADGSAFDHNINLVLTSKSKAEMNKLNAGVDKAAKGSVLAGLYDIRLQKDGIDIQPEKKVKISIPLSKEMKEMTELKAVYIDDNGVVTILAGEIAGGKMVFTTDHFSNYGIIGKIKAQTSEKEDANKQTLSKENTSVKTTSVKTGDESPVAFYFIICGMAVLCIAGVGILRIKKKR
jgi:hypothetical protein